MGEKHIWISMDENLYNRFVIMRKIGNDMKLIFEKCFATKAKF